MYTDHNKFGPVRRLFLLLLLALAVFAAWRGVSSTEGERKEQGARAVKTAVERAALQCYAVEGQYPEDLEYLEENYGLQVNGEDYIVTYDAFASNQPPTVKVTIRQ